MINEDKDITHQEMMMTFRRFLLAALLFILPVEVSAQFVDLGQDPSGTRWRQIETRDFQIIYPDFFEQQAREVAKLYARLYAHANSLGTRARKISMIVRANGGQSNGNAGWAPKKSELYAVPPQDANVEWMEHLCVHEFRHVVQYDRINQGVSRVLYRVFGEQYTMALVGLFVPMWLLEGDAVVFETAATKGGRGRSPEFLNEVKARVVEKGVDPYRKAVLGSNAEIIPDRYATGYFMVGNARRHYGKELWQEVFERVGRKPHELFPLSLAIREATRTRRDSLWNTPGFRLLFDNPDSAKRANEGWKSVITLYRDNFSELRGVWEREALAINHRFDTISIPSPGLAANYHSPVPAGNGRVYAYKVGPGEAGAIVELRDGRERVIAKVGSLPDPHIAYRDGLVVWSEYKPHPRWEHGGKMAIVSLDVASGRRRRHASDANRFAPFPAWQGAWGWVEVDENNRASIVIAEADFAREVTRVEAGEGELFIHPSFDERGAVLAVSLSPAGMQVASIDLKSGQREALTAREHAEIDRPIAARDGIFYRAAWNGNNAIYGTDPGGPVVESRFGARYPSLSAGKDTLYFSFYTSDGYRPALLPLERRLPGEIARRPFDLADALASDEEWNFTPAEDSASYRGTPYRETLHAVNVHSWGPFFPDRDEVNARPGLAVSSQDKLSTFYWTGGYVWDDGYEGGNWRLNATYKGLWPIFKLNARDGRIERRNVQLTTSQEEGKADTARFTDRARETRLSASVEFPVNFSDGGRRRFFTPRVVYSPRWTYRHEVRDLFLLEKGSWVKAPATDDRFTRPATWSRVAQCELVFYSLDRASARELYPRRGERLGVGYARAWSSGAIKASTWWADANLYFPGAARYHSVALYAGYQQKSDPLLLTGNQVLSPRGIFVSGRRFATTRLSYYLPLAYPDRSLTPLVYFRQFNAGVFLDVAAAEHERRFSVAGDKESAVRVSRETRTFRSFGLEVTSDARFLDLTFPVNIGFRAGHESMSNAPFVNFLFSVGLSI